MMFNLIPLRCRLISVPLFLAFLASCSSGGNSSVQPESTDSPIVTPESGGSGNDCDASTQNCDNTQSTDSEIPVVSLGVPVNGSVAAQRSNLYKVPTDSQVVLKVRLLCSG